MWNTEMNHPVFLGSVIIFCIRQDCRTRTPRQVDRDVCGVTSGVSTFVARVIARTSKSAASSRV